MEYLLDSYAWLEYFGGNSRYAPYLETTDTALPFTVVISLTEVIRSLKRKGFEREEINRASEFMMERSIILPLEKENAIKAGFEADELGLHFSDALIYAFTKGNRILVTGDPHFKKLQNVEFIT